MALSNPNLLSPIPESVIPLKVTAEAPIIQTSRTDQLGLLEQIKQNPGAAANPFVSLLGLGLTSVFLYQGLKAIVAGEPPPLLKKMA